MRIARRVALFFRNIYKLTDAPWISAEKPVAMRGHNGTELLIASHFFIEDTLRHKRRRQMIATPDKRHSDEIWIRLRAEKSAEEEKTLKLAKMEEESNQAFNRMKSRVANAADKLYRAVVDEVIQIK